MLKDKLDSISKNKKEIPASKCWDMIYDKFVETARKNNVSDKISVVFERTFGGANVYIYVDEYLCESFETSFSLNDACLAKEHAKENGIEFKTFDGLHPKVKFIYNY